MYKYSVTSKTLSVLRKSVNAPALPWGSNESLGCHITYTVIDHTAQLSLPARAGAAGAVERETPTFFPPSQSTRPTTRPQPSTAIHFRPMREGGRRGRRSTGGVGSASSRRRMQLGCSSIDHPPELRNTSATIPAPTCDSVKPLNEQHRVTRRATKLRTQAASAPALPKRTIQAIFSLPPMQSRQPIDRVSSSRSRIMQPPINCSARVWTFAHTPPCQEMPHK